MASASHFLLLLGLTSALLAAASGCDDADRAPACPPGWTQYGARCFIFHMNYRTWLEAETFCIANGGNLASIHNLDEHFFIKNMIYRSAAYDYESWIGGFDAVEEGTWMWTDGSPFNYRRWYDYEPDNGAASGYSSENCLETNVDYYFWGDEACDTENPFVCSRDAAV